jgi:hypothetical protein
MTEFVDPECVRRDIAVPFTCAIRNWTNKTQANTLRSLGWVAAMASLLLSACGGGTPPPAPATLTLEIARRPVPTIGILPNEPPPAGAADEFKTDFSIHSVPYAEVLSGGPPKDGIPAIDSPAYVSVTDADTWLKPMEPVVFVEIAGDARAFPLQVLVWHELVNTQVGDTPLVVTFCPLCNTAIAFERTVSGTVLDFGATGRLRFSNLIMYDRATESWWQQANGRAIAGKFTGTQLNFRPASIIAWADFKSAHPAGKVLSRATGFSRPYGRNPYPGYDDITRPPFLFKGPATPGVLPAVARVLGVALGGRAIAYPYDALKSARVVNSSVGGQDIVVLWQAGTTSPFSGDQIASGADVGSASAYSRVVGGRQLTFRLDGPRIVDAETGSAWNGLGRAVDGPLAGQSLTPVVGVDHFWFSWAVFNPDTTVYTP